MPDLQTLKDDLDFLKNQDILLKQQRDNLETRIKKLENRILGELQSIQDKKIAIAILTEVSTKARNDAKGHFEKIITDALQFITQSTDYKFVIKEGNNKSKATYEFYVESTINGVKCLQKPESANGGGFVDIMSVAMKFAYLEIFNDPKIKSATILCDEPGKMISADMSIKFAEYLKFLGEHYNRQIIMVTHNENIANVATKTFSVVKNNNGVSNVTDTTFDLTNHLLNLLNGAKGVFE